MTHNGQILVVDDNENLRKTMSRILSMKGYDVLTAANGIEALQIATVNPYIDLVFLDIKMPLMNGVETHKRLQEIIPDSVVLMMTAYAVEELVDEALDNGAYGILYKPMEIDGVMEIIENAKSSNIGALVLVVDDDSGTRKSLREVLEKKGFQVAVAENGNEAVTLAKSSSFDILFIDMKLPTINVLETYLSIKDIRPNAVAVLITGSERDIHGFVDEAMLNSSYSCLHKPLDMVQVFTIVDEILSRKKGVG